MRVALWAGLRMMMRMRMKRRMLLLLLATMVMLLHPRTLLGLLRALHLLLRSERDGHDSLLRARATCQASHPSCRSAAQ